jgi:chromosome segregation ATPase
MTEADAIRAALLDAAEALLSGDAPGPLTGVRLAELAGVKRHRLTHGNPDIAADFKDRASQVNRHRPEVDRLRKDLERRQKRNAELFVEVSELRERLAKYATRIDELVVERDRLLEELQLASNVSSIPRRPRAT